MRTELDEISNDAHDKKANANRLANLDELALVGYNHEVSLGNAATRAEDERFVQRLTN